MHASLCLTRAELTKYLTTTKIEDEHRHFMEFDALQYARSTSIYLYGFASQSKPHPNFKSHKNSRYNKQ
jgi:hypothetical protein